MANPTTSSTIVVGRSFDSFEDLQAVIKRWQEENCVSLGIRDSRKCKPEAEYAARLQRERIVWECVHGSSRKSRGGGTRPARKTMKLQCPFRLIVATASVEGRRRLKVVTFQNDHNHDVSSELRDHPAETTVKYEFVRYSCKHGPKRQTKSTGLRPNQKTVKHDCPAHLRLVKAKRDDQFFLRVSHSDLNHSNHPVDGEKADNSYKPPTLQVDSPACEANTATVASTHPEHNGTVFCEIEVNSFDAVDEKQPQASFVTQPTPSYVPVQKAPSKRRKVSNSPASPARVLFPPPVVTDDRHDAFGKSVAHKLRGLPHEQRVFAEKIISDALFEAELGSLTRHSAITTVPLSVLAPEVCGAANSAGVVSSTYVQY